MPLAKMPRIKKKGLKSKTVKLTNEVEKIKVNNEVVEEVSTETSELVPEDEPNW